MISIVISQLVVNELIVYKVSLRHDENTNVNCNHIHSCLLQQDTNVPHIVTACFLFILRAWTSVRLQYVLISFAFSFRSVY